MLGVEDLLDALEIVNASNATANASILAFNGVANRTTVRGVVRVGAAALMRIGAARWRSVVPERNALLVASARAARGSLVRTLRRTAPASPLSFCRVGFHSGRAQTTR